MEKHWRIFLLAPFWRVGEGSKFPEPYWSRISAAISPLYERIAKTVELTLPNPANEKTEVSQKWGWGYQNSPCFLMILSLSLVGKSVFSNILPKMDKGCIFLDSETILNFGDVKALLENQIWVNGCQSTNKAQTQN